MISWATEALHAIRRQLWRSLKGNPAAKAVKGLGWMLLRNWATLSVTPRATIRELETSNRRLFRAWQLKEEPADIFEMSLFTARRALDDWLYYAKPKAFITMVMLDRGGLGLDLPRRPDPTTKGALGPKSPRSRSHRSRCELRYGARGPRIDNPVFRKVGAL